MWKRSPPSSGNGLPGLEPRVEVKVTRASAVVSHIGFAPRFLVRARGDGAHGSEPTVFRHERMPMRKRVTRAGLKLVLIQVSSPMADPRVCFSIEFTLVDGGSPQRGSG